VTPAYDIAGKNYVGRVSVEFSALAMNRRLGLLDFPEPPQQLARIQHFCFRQIGKIAAREIHFVW
jgi:hypothetical protein